MNQGVCSKCEHDYPCDAHMPVEEGSNPTGTPHTLERIL